MMKRILIALLFVFSCIGAMAQNANEHLKFMGIPINGTLESFTQKLVAKGMKRQLGARNMGFVRGTFAGKDNCNIYIERINSRNVVFRVVVCLPSKKMWEWLESDYTEFKAMLTSKYGEPKFCSESFKEGASTYDNSSKMLATLSGKCNYFASWQVDGGVIDLEIFKPDGELDCFVRLQYFDRINYKLADSSKQDDL